MSAVPNGSTDRILPRAVSPSGFPDRLPPGQLYSQVGNPQAPILQKQNEEQLRNPSRGSNEAISNTASGHNGTTSTASARLGSIENGSQPENSPSQFAAFLGGAVRSVNHQENQNPFRPGFQSGVDSRLSPHSPPSQYAPTPNYLSPGNPINTVHPVNTSSDQVTPMQAVMPAHSSPWDRPNGQCPYASSAGNDNHRSSMDQDVQRIIYIVKHRKTLVSDLRGMLKDANLKMEGVKQVKVDRIAHYATNLRSNRQQKELNYLRQIVEKYAPTDVQAPGRPLGPVTSNKTTSTPSRGNVQTPVMRPNMSARNARRPSAVGDGPTLSVGNNPLSPQTTLFKPSPFYTLGLAIRPPLLFVKPYARRKISDQMIFPVDALDLSRSPNHVFLVCQEFKPHDKRPQPMFFPFYNEIELDGVVLPVNTRGVRGISGSARPVDLRPYLLDSNKSRRDTGAYPKDKSPSPIVGGLKKHTLRINITISDQAEKMSDQSFKFALFYGIVHSDEELMNTLKNRPHITKVETQQLAASIAMPVDDDIMSSDAVLSLKDKVMFTRINVPIRSRECSHIDCFDAETFLMLQKQAETWKCPVCNKIISWENLAVDDFFSEILGSAGPEAESVVIKPDGTWVIEEETDPGDNSESDSEDDWFARRGENEIRAQNPSGQVNGDKNRSNGQQRRVEEVVSLLSDSEDENNSGQRASEPQSRIESRNEPRRNSPPQSEPGAAIDSMISAFAGAHSSLFDSVPAEISPQSAPKSPKSPSRANGDVGSNFETQEQPKPRDLHFVNQHEISKASNAPVSQAKPIDDDVIDLTAD